MRAFKRRERLMRAALRPRRRGPRIRPGIPPGTLAAPEAATAPATLSVITFTSDEVVERTVAGVDEALTIALPDGVVWINVDGLGRLDVIARLGERLGLHPLALEDALNVPQRPKVERYDTHYFVVLRTVRLAPDIEEEQVSVFFARHWVVTIQERAGGDPFEAVRQAIRERRGRVREKRGDYLGYLLLDAVVDAYFPALDSMGDRVEALEAEALEAKDELLLDLRRMRHEVLALRRAVWPVREEITVLQRDDAGIVEAETKTFLRDTLDHAVQAIELVESLRETLTTAMNIYLSAQNQRLNSIMKLLAVITTLFIPLTFIASIYGMNFEFMPELTWGYGYPWALSLMALTALAMAFYFRWRGWW